MFDVKLNGPNRIDIEFGGKLDSNAMKTAIDEMVEITKDIEHGQMLYRIVDFDLPTLGAIGVELSHIPELFKFIKKFDHAAVLTDKKWVQKISEIEGALIPGLEIKAFDLNQAAEAEAWLATKS